MYNKYFDEAGEMFSGLYRPIEESSGKSCEESCRNDIQPERRGFDIKRLISRLDIDKIGLLPLILLLLLLLDVDDEEKIIIIALAVIFGI